MVSVMLIDQEYLFQKAFRKMLDGIDDCNLVGVAQTGEEALDMVNSHHPQVVFADVVLGKENGISLCRRIKELFPSTLVYILTNYCNLNLIKNWMMAGLDQYLLKPVSKSKIASLIFENHHVIEDQRDEYSVELFQAIDKRDYKEAYDAARVLTDHIFEREDASERKDKLEGIASGLMYMVPGMDRTQMNYYLQKYELTPKILSRSTLSYCWLIQFITEVFRQLCVLKYTHMNQALQYIESHKNYEISITELADQAGISSGYLSRIFKKYYHISVVDYIHLRKLHMAKQYMVSSEMNISDISFLLGYSEAGYFCKIFKKYEGQTPSAFMNQYIKNR
ncbi:MAG: response regulator [Eubacterium sp.]|nr:response regulator [Eubacterium sp.]